MFSGTDAKYFVITPEAGALSFIGNDADTDADESHTPNFEDKSSYSITIVATSGTDDRLLRTRLAVTVTVIDGEDQGMVTLSQREPQEGQTVIATISDPDGSVAMSPVDLGNRGRGRRRQTALLSREALGQT